MGRSSVPFVSGLLFSLGLVLSGMTQPAKVTAFLDLSSTWDPSLALVMVGAIAVHSLGLRMGRRVDAALRPAFAVGARAALSDRRLLAGAALFGVGWGLSGSCPGPALVVVASGAWPSIATFAAMLAGIGLGELWLGVRTGSEPSCAEADTA